MEQYNVLIKTVSEKTTKGLLEDVVSILNSTKLQLTAKHAIKLVVACCSACNKVPDNVPVESLYSTLRYVVPFIKDPTDLHVNSYFQSLFFILKLMLQKECFSEVLMMKDIFIPHFMPSVLTPDQKEVYQNICKLFFNTIAKYGNGKEIYRKDTVVELSYLLTLLKSKISCRAAVLETAFNCTLVFSNLEMDPDIHGKYYCCVLELLPEEIDSDTTFKHFLNFLTFVLMNYLRKNEFKKADAFYFKAFLMGNAIFKRKEFAYLHNVLKDILFFLPLETNKKQNFKSTLTTNFNNMCKILNHSNSHSLVSKLTHFLHPIITYYKNCKPTAWCDFSEDLQLEFFNFLYELSNFLIKAKCDCPNFNTETNTYEAAKFIALISTLTRIYFKGKTNISQTYKYQCLRYMEKFCEPIKQLKGNGSEKWEVLWTDLGTSLYNKGTALFYKEDPDVFMYYQSFIKNCIYFEGRKPIILKELYCSAFKGLCDFYLKQKDYKKCMVFVALNTYFCTYKRESIISRWIMSKVGLRETQPDNEEIQQLTLVSVINKYSDVAKQLDPTFCELNSEDKITLLIFELKHYKSKWKSKLPMYITFKELYEIADLYTIVKIASNIFGECDLQLHKDLPVLFHKILTRFESKAKNFKNIEYKIYLAILYYLHYKCCVKDIVAKNCDDMEKLTLTDKPTIKPSTHKDPNEECDIVSAYESLKLDQYFPIMKYLNTALSTLFTVSTSNDLSKGTNEIKRNEICKLLLRIAFEYRLHLYNILSMEALQLILKIAENSDLHIRLQTISLIIEKSDVRNSCVKSLLEEGNKIVKELNLEDAKSMELVLFYNICKCKALLYHDHVEAFAIFEETQKLYYDNNSRIQLGYIKAWLLTLHFRFILMPCSFGIQDHSMNTINKIQEANTAIFDDYNNNRLDNGSLELSILFEVNEEIVALYYNMRMPREVRCYSRETIILAQKLVLPLRSASLLFHLAHADIRTSRFDDSQVKLTGLSEILCLPNHRSYTCKIDEEYVQEQQIKADKDMEKVTNDMQEMMLDLPSSAYNKQATFSSPSLTVERFKVPSFMHHDVTCTCFYCMCTEYHQLILSKLHLESIFNAYQNNTALANDFFIGSMKLYEKMRCNFTHYQKKVKKFLPFEVAVPFEEQFLDVYCPILLEYIRHLIRCNKKTEAIKYNLELLQALKKNKVKLVYLYNEALMQRMNLIVQSPIVPGLQQTNVVDELSADFDAATCLSKTPESKQSKVYCSERSTPALKTPKRFVKCVPLNLSPSENEENDEIVKKESTVLHVTKSPLIQTSSTFKIYSAKPVRKKKTSTADSDNGFNSNESSIASSTKIDIDLKTKTKILTEKLKQSSIKKPIVPSIIVTDENVCQNSKRSTREKNVPRKNLFTDLATNDQSGSSKGAVRRTTRNKK